MREKNLAEQEGKVGDWVIAIKAGHGVEHPGDRYEVGFIGRIDYWFSDGTFGIDEISKYCLNKSDFRLYDKEKEGMYEIY